MKRIFICYEANKTGFIRLFHIKGNQRILRAKRIKTKANILLTSGFWPPVRARALRAPVFFNSLPSQTGRCAPLAAHRSFAASYSALKNIYNLSNLGRPRQGLFSFHWTTVRLPPQSATPPH
jgi:hypothetical protein